MKSGNPIQQERLIPIAAFVPTFVPLLGWNAEDDVIRATVLVVGLAALFAGVFLMRHHQREMARAEAAKLDARLFAIARRKFRRRMSSSLVIALIGVLLAALYWAVNPRVFAALILLTLFLLLLLFLMALYDMFHIGIEAIVDPRDEQRKELVEEVLRRREDLDLQASDEERS